MSRTKKKLIITFSIIGIVLVFVASFLMLFAINRINIEFVSFQNRTGAYQEADIKADCNIKKGRNIVFINTEKSINTLEAKYPYAKFQVSRTFPSTMTIYVYEREPVFKVKNTNEYFEIYDEDLKCLEIVAESNLADNNLDNVPTLSGLDLDLCGEEGKFLENPTLKNKITNILDGVYGAEQTEIGIMSDIIFGYDQINDFETLTLKVRPSQQGKDNAGTITIQGSAYIKEKLFYATTLYIQISDQGKYKTSLDKLEIKVLRNFNPNSQVSKYIVASIAGSQIGG